MASPLESDLQLSKGIVTLLLTGGLLGAHGNELVDAVSHSPVDARGAVEEPGEKDRRTEGQRDRGMGDDDLKTTVV